MGETRVNLKRLLEDIRDSYPLPWAEIILTEMVANSLDSGASSIWLVTDKTERTLTVIDNGRGMRASELSTYHDIAATTKLRGKGIGFAGIGAKLALLGAQSVITETKMGEKHHATSWSLSGPMRAPWKPITPPGWLKESSGTAVRITLPPGKSSGESLIHSSFVQEVLLAHFAPLLDEEFLKRLGRLYTHRISFFLEDQLLLPDPRHVGPNRRFFYVRLAKTKRPIGVGFLVVSDDELTESQRGIAISTYGKVIKRGWEWVGTMPVRPSRISGMIEIPALAQILTTNKADFLKDQASLRIYYRYRKAIQAAIEPILAELGEQPILAPSSSQKLLGSTERLTLQEVLTEMVAEFPELEPLVGTRRAGADEGNEPSSFPETFSHTPLLDQVESATPPPEGEANGESSDIPSETLTALSQPSSDGEDSQIHETIAIPSNEPKRTKRKPALSIGYEEDSTRNALGWLSDETIWVNKGHPAYRKAADMGYERYHTVIAVGLVLAAHVREVNPTRGNVRMVEEFLTRYLSSWGCR